jgi:group II intron reverse transcriptase/maturase
LEVVLMAQQFVSPKTESELRVILDQLYAESKTKSDKGEKPSFRGLLEIISAEPTIVTAIHNLKANKGSQTVGSDNERMQEDILEKDYQAVISRVQESLKNHRPKDIKRVYIPKPGKSELRPLGIPSIIDRIVQECVRIILDPICEAQFFNHSYGFRPWRSAQQALERVTNLVHDTGYHWIIEGDISKYFDTISHTILLKKLYHMGIKDRRVLMIIKQMLKAGITGEVRENPLGTCQGGIISPLLANVYLHTFDEWCAKQWETKKTRIAYSAKDTCIRALRLRSNLKPGYLVRYADDWVLVTNSRRNAEQWKWRITKFLKEELRLKLSEEKTVITNIREKAIHFLGFEYKIVPSGKARKGYTTCTKPDIKRIRAKIKEVHKNIKKIRKAKDDNEKIFQISRVNLMIRGIINYYQSATRVNPVLSKFVYYLRYAGYKTLSEFGGKWIPANQTTNLIAAHKGYTSQIPAIEINDMNIGITLLAFCSYTPTYQKNPAEIPYTPEGRKLHFEFTKKRPLLAREDDLFSLVSLKFNAFHNTNPLYNFEYLMNRAYAYNRDKGTCRICGGDVIPQELHCHHKDPSLPKPLVNKVNNLATTHDSCHPLIHNDSDISHLNSKIQKRILGFRKIIR